MGITTLTLRASICVALTTMVLGGAAAQEREASRDNEKDKPLLEEVIVTAERRAQSLQDVPLSITAFGDEKRDRMGIVTVQDMTNFAPGLSYNTSNDRASIRGIARQSNFHTLDSPVAQYSDGVYTTSVWDAQRRPLFVDRTEILRGPQGALSGRGSIAGAINIISKKPSDQFSAEGRGFYGSYSRFGLESTISGPITDWMQGRLNLGHYRQNKGYFNNVANGRTEGDMPNNRDTVEGYLTAQFGDHFDWFFKTAIFDSDESRRTGFTTAPYVSGILSAPSAYGPSSGTLNPIAQWGYFSPLPATQLGTYRQNPVIVTGDERNYANDWEARQKVDEHHNVTSQLAWHLSGADVKWTSGHQHYVYRQWTDADGTDVLTMTLPVNTFFPTGRVVSPGGTNYYMEQQKWWSNELTITSTGDGPVSWIGGLYQSTQMINQEPSTTTYQGYNELNTPFATIDRLLQLLGQPFNAANAARVVPANPYPNTSLVGLFTGKTVTSAAFGQVDYKLNDLWKFTVGARYSKDEKDVREKERIIANGLGSLGGFLAGGANFPGLPAGPRSVDVTPVLNPALPLAPGVVADYGIDPVTGYRVRDLGGEWTGFTGSAGVDFTPRKGDLVYLRAARGYRPGGFSAGFLYDPPMVDEETVNSYEIGYKTTLFDRLQLAASVFYYDYRDIQLPLPTLGRCVDPNDLSTCTTLNAFVNLPKGETKGFELEATWAVTDQLGLFLSYGYLDASIKDGLAPGSSGFSNPDDPAAVLPSAKPLAQMISRTATPCPLNAPPPGCSTGTGGVPGGPGVPGSVLLAYQRDSTFTFLPRWTQDITGNKLANSPENKLAFNVSYDLSFTAGKLTLSGTVQWRDDAYSDAFQTEVAKIPSYSTVGARIIWVGANERYTVMLYGSNLTDEVAYDGAGVTRIRTGLATSNATASTAGAAYYPTYNLTPPREFGLELQYRIGAAK